MPVVFKDKRHCCLYLSHLQPKFSFSGTFCGFPESPGQRLNPSPGPGLLSPSYGPTATKSLLLGPGTSRGLLILHTTQIRTVGLVPARHHRKTGFTELCIIHKTIPGMAGWRQTWGFSLHSRLFRHDAAWEPEGGGTGQASHPDSTGAPTAQRAVLGPSGPSVGVTHWVRSGISTCLWIAKQRTSNQVT